MNVLSIQSAVAYGHVGNSAAVFALQRLGHEVWPIDTVQFSCHTGYPGWQGEVFPPAQLTALIDGLAACGALAGCDAVLSGYLGAAATGAVVLDAVWRLRESRPGTLFCCDPVMGDTEHGLFVAADIPAFFARSAIPAADIVTPNCFELSLLTGRSLHDLGDLVAAARHLRRQGPGTVAVTGVTAPLLPSGRIGAVVVTAEGAWLAETPLLEFPTPPHGTGDVFAALLLGRLLTGEQPTEALAKTVGALYAILLRTQAAMVRELTLIAAQDQLATPESYPTATSID